MPARCRRARASGERRSPAAVVQPAQPLRTVVHPRRARRCRGHRRASTTFSSRPTRSTPISPIPARRTLRFASLGADVAARTLSLTSATKAFNLAGVRCAVGYCGSEALLARYTQRFNPMMHGVSPFGLAATRAAWTRADEWLARCVAYLDGNRRWFAATIAECLPALRHRMPEATYLAWVDGRGLGLDVSAHGALPRAGPASRSPTGPRSVMSATASSASTWRRRASILEQIVERMVSCLPPASARRTGAVRSPLRPTVTRSSPSHFAMSASSPASALATSLTSTPASANAPGTTSVFALRSAFTSTRATMRSPCRNGST